MPRGAAGNSVMAVPVYNIYYHEFKATYGKTSTKGIANTKYILSHLINDYGWLFPAVCGILGNLQAESALNPNSPEKSREDGFPYYAPGDSRLGGNYGFGLAQWTPWYRAYNKYWEPEGDRTPANGDGMGHPTFYYYCLNTLHTGEVTADDNNPIGKMEPQLNYLTNVPWGYTIYERWKDRGYYYNYNWAQFKQIKDPQEAAGAWLFNYERPGSVSNPDTTYDKMLAALNARKKNGQWYYDTYREEFGGGVTPPSPTPTAKILKGGKNVWRILHLIQQF